MTQLLSLDAKDIQILEILQFDARISIAELGRRVVLAQPSAYERVRRLEDAGVIEGYGARISSKALGLGLMSIVRLKTSHEHIASCLKQFAQIPNILEVHRVTGEDCFVLKVLVPTPEDLEPIVDRIAKFGALTTSIVLRSEPLRPINKSLIELTSLRTKRVFRESMK